MSRFSDIHPSKKVTQRKISYLTIYNTLSFVEERILPKTDDVNFVILNTYYSNWVHFLKLVQAKKNDQYEMSFPTIYNTLIFTAKKKFVKHADVNSHVTLETCLPWKISSVAYTNHLCKFSYFCHDLHDNLIFLT